MKDEMVACGMSQEEDWTNETCLSSHWKDTYNDVFYRLNTMKWPNSNPGTSTEAIAAMKYTEVSHPSIQFRHHEGRWAAAPGEFTVKQAGMGSVVRYIVGIVTSLFVSILTFFDLPSVFSLSS